MFLKFFNEQYFKIAFLVTTGFMTLLALIILVNPDDGNIQFTYLIQLVIITFLFLSVFLENIVFKVVDTFKGYSNKLADSIQKLSNIETRDYTNKQPALEETDNIVDGDFSDY